MSETNCVFNYTDAQKGGETSNISNLLEDDAPDYRGLFDRDSTPRNYLDNGNFYSQDKPRKLVIDLSQVDKVEAAIWWYDKVLEEFPGTLDAKEALRQKIRTLIGWTDGHGRFHGLHADKNAEKYFSLLEATFLKFETDYPDDPYLEALAFQIAQQYYYHVWAHGKPVYKKDCRHWFKKTIAFAKGKDTFYSHLSKLHLKSVQPKKLEAMPLK